jgi:hypothetical protein
MKTSFSFSLALVIVALLQSCKTVDVLREVPQSRQEFVYVFDKNECLGDCYNGRIEYESGMNNTFKGWSADPRATRWEEQSGNLSVVRALCNKVALTQQQFEESLVTGRRRVVSSENWVQLVYYYMNEFTPDYKFVGRSSPGADSDYGNCIGKKYLIEVDEGTRLEVVGAKKVPFWDNSVEAQRADHARKQSN